MNLSSATTGSVRKGRNKKNTRAKMTKERCLLITGKICTIFLAIVMRYCAARIKNPRDMEKKHPKIGDHQTPIMTNIIDGTCGQALSFSRPLLFPAGNKVVLEAFATTPAWMLAHHSLQRIIRRRGHQMHTERLQGFLVKFSSIGIPPKKSSIKTNDWTKNS